MTQARSDFAAAAERPRIVAILSFVLLFLLCSAQPAWATGTPAGTVVDNVAVVNFDLGGVPTILNSNNASFQVLERLDVVVTLQSGQVIVSPNMVDAALLFT